MSLPLFAIVMVGAVAAYIGGGIVFWMARINLLAELQYRHASVWHDLGRPTGSSWKTLQEQIVSRARLRSFIWSGRFRALDDSKIARLCNIIRLCTVAMATAFAVAATIFIMALH